MLSTLMWLTLALVILATQGYTIMARFLRLLLHTYFRKIEVYGLNNFPREGPVILCPNHPNMLVDAILVMTEAIIQAGAVPVYRPRRKETSLADVDSDKTPEELEAANRAMFEHTWGVLADNNVMVLFPEGTSYTAPKMLSLRTGLNYFSKDHFRSQMTLEFGPPMVITPELVHSDVFQQDEHREVKRLTHDLEERMHDLTLNASDFTIIHAARMMRRLYLSTPGTIDALKEVRLTQFIIRMLEAKPENEEQKDRIKRTCEKVLQYKEQLEKLRLKDQEVNQSMPNEQSLIKLFFERILYLLVLLPLATPGLLLNFPYYFIGKKLNRLAGFVESKSMFKIFAAGVLVPVHWLVLILATWFFFGSSYAYVLAVGLPLLLYSHIRVLEESRSIAENVYFLFNIATHAEQVSALRKERELLARDVHTLVESFVDANFLSALHKSIAISPVNRRFYHRTSSISDSLLAR
ncbi:acyltransferase domain containing protein [Plasmopara halstedii]|uniref:Acyltransferase domain containing protein n=1 Tax=Plasmopara halstedii TaxID=4781 RepID=A0A0P1B3Z7_PLAHL|nr:acyltransferase domain containing protein [Plasmopara halstedii]CEG48644.1 acyltransferase domain containing protein [Plasmopara halstedii]|eukprot:XP_024585013.1 acyltransferase domain containing protein [Plasmopara halstedii]